MKSINIIFRSTGVGLDQDALIVKTALEKSGHQCTLSRYKDISWLQSIFIRKTKYDANIFLERVHPRWLKLAKKNYLIPNQERFPKRHIPRLKHIDKILCKSHHAEEIFRQLGFPTEYIGFTSPDRNLPEIKPDFNKFFHLAGKSTLKGTETILELWEKHPEWPQLTLIQHKENAPESVPKNVTLITDFVSEEKLREMQNSHGVHLCPSRSEGWGHYIVEAMSCGAVVITTDAPPMNEIVTLDTGILLPIKSQEPRHLGISFYVSPLELEASLSALSELTKKEFSKFSDLALLNFQEKEQSFSAKISRHFFV